MNKGQVSIRNGIEDILFPMSYCRITQGDNEGTHLGTYASDLAGIDTGIDNLYAPVTLKCVALNPSDGNASWWQSINKVRFADGSIDYLTMMILHDNNLSKIGLIVKQGEILAKEGTTGKAIGNHLHVEFAKGKFKKKYERNKQGVWHLPNNLAIEKVCFMDNTNIILGIADWKYLKDIKVNKVDQILYPNEKFKFSSSYIVEKIDIKNDLVYNSILGNWIPAKYLVEINGNQILNINERFKIEGIFTVGKINKNLVEVKELGIYVKADSLIEV